MKWSIILAMLWVTAASAGAADTPRTMRVDYYHTGNSTQEMFALDQVVLEPLPWPGNPHKPIDSSNLGAYLFEVVDPTSKKVLYSRGFCSVFGEWVTTAEARSINRTYHESLRFPAPATAVRVVLKKRDAANQWREAWALNVDPSARTVNTSEPDSPGPVVEIEKNGDPGTKVDVLLIGDGYRAEQRAKFEADSRRLVDRLFATSPFKERRKDFNIWGLCPPSREAGVSRPSARIHRASPLQTSYDAFGLDRYMLTFDNKSLRRIACVVPYDFVVILANSRDYGGGGIFGLYSTVAVDHAAASYVFVHEFGHHFAGLADEYYTSVVSYLPSSNRVEPWEPNVTALLDPARLKWKDLVTAQTPLPTPWSKDEFESRVRQFQKRRAELRKSGRSEAEVEAIFREEQRLHEQALKNDKFAGRVGAFEGANYSSKGYFRSELDCIMFTRTTSFCAVCRRAIAGAIDLYTLDR